MESTMFREARSAATAYDTVRPYVDRALQDDEIRTNVFRAWNAARKVSGEWRIGLAGDATTELKDALGPPRVALVLGAEGPGMRSNTRDHCDALARLPISDAVESLNVSNAAAVALYAASVA
jgi:tRNA G18 (ribose-2'-O)-methylase SpoU